VNKIRFLNFSESCERNKQPILEKLQQWFVAIDSVLEIGSGSGQHGVYFSQHLSHLRWQPSDTGEYISGLEYNLKQIASSAKPVANINPPVPLDVLDSEWPISTTAALFTANSLHIMGENEVEHFFRGAGKVVKPGGVLVVYGPFRYQNQFTSPSNEQFDGWLKHRDPRSGVRDFEWVCVLADAEGFDLVEDISMPANNQLLCWRRG